MTRLNSWAVLAGLLTAGVAAPVMADEAAPPAAPAGQPMPAEDPRDAKIRILEQKLEESLKRLE